MLNVDNVSCLRGERRLITALSFTVQQGRLLAVTGENGSGKTSLLRMLCGLLPPEQGRILWEDQDVRACRERFLASLIYVGHLNSLKDDLTPVENVTISARLAGEEISEGKTCEALEAVGLARVIHRLPTRVLSQGQKRRVSLARLWMSQRPLWILDEPFAALDASATGLLMQQLRSHLHNGGIVIAATHQEIDVGADRLDQLRLAG
ncbi:MAG: cytochrome c biogenesis heme-transporting ATPase CcmA [Nitrospirae bacterium]|nr:cytochrome c biogenesis heme-transporting ATPase CcmA [Nitrospirota bacterium]MBU6482021.1 cytochrome c biogenesis heme-transporting ATPase CcmA [Nitrospirota bacterium]MDE3042056.1 cytochrome c biogenesis heme-transporting ATPase CcmA [Nitrospirota bacterium]MDE3220385.1 cytochrome c biogenesis heme-transporting ATPase CcmA [Nitrospirota bacterium]